MKELKYFTLDEFQCKHCGAYPENGMSEVLLEKLDELREKVGDCVYVTSGYRCPIHNARVGGVPDSQHVQGRAADIITSAVSVSRLAEIAREVGFDGLGVYPYDGFIHVDCRDDGGSPNYYNWEG